MQWLFCGLCCLVFLVPLNSELYQTGTVGSMAFFLIQSNVPVSLTSSLTGTEDGDLTQTTCSSTAILTTSSPLTQREQIQVAPLIDFDNEPPPPPAASLSQQNGLVEPVIDLTDTSPDQLLMNGAPPLIELPNDRTSGLAQKKVGSSELCDSGEVRWGVEGGVREGVEVKEVGSDMDSVTGSQELF